MEHGHEHGYRYYSNASGAREVKAGRETGDRLLVEIWMGVGHPDQVKTGHGAVPGTSTAIRVQTVAVGR